MNSSRSIRMPPAFRPFRPGSTARPGDFRPGYLSDPLRQFEHHIFDLAPGQHPGVDRHAHGDAVAGSPHQEIEIPCHTTPDLHLKGNNVAMPLTGADDSRIDILRDRYMGSDAKIYSKHGIIDHL